MTNREKEFQLINETQEYYVDELIKAIKNKNNDCFKELNFTSDTGTGKTNMMALLCNKCPNIFFIITTLSKGQLKYQIADNLKKLVINNNFKVYGLNDYTSNTILQKDDIINELPTNKKIIWLRDEGHIHTNKWCSILENYCWKIINISATNKEAGIRCNFTHTMMLRSVNQMEGTPADALDKLLEVKENHKMVSGYNPCAIMRSLDTATTDIIIEECKKRNLKYINITDEDFDMSALCKDDNEYDVIINKFKIVEGIDIRRAHVLYLTNEPKNVATTIQLIGRCRRNALLYRNDVPDICSSKNIKLLKATRECYVYFNVKNMKVDSDEDGNLCPLFCNTISCEKLKAGSIIKVKKGQMNNGLFIKELEGITGTFEILNNGKFNYVDNPDFYKKEVISKKIPAINVFTGRASARAWGYNLLFFKPIAISDVLKLTCENQQKAIFDYSTGTYIYENLGFGYDITNLLRTKPEIKNPVFGSRECKTYDINKLDIHNNVEQHHTIILADDLHDYIQTMYKPYNLIYNDKMSAMIGTDLMQYNSKTESWFEAKAVTNKIGKYTKLNTFISYKYKKQLQECKDKLFLGKNKFSFDTRCNSCLGYVAEYYAKYLLYGQVYIRDELTAALKEAHSTELNTFIIIRACMLKYRDNMRRAFGENVGKLIRTISVTLLIQDKYKEFCNTVMMLGERIAAFVKKEFNIVDEPSAQLYDPVLSVKHISALADFICEDTIIDVKCTNSITDRYIRQVLAYHYLSTKRSDLHIKRVIVYDAVSDKSVIVNV